MKTVKFVNSSKQTVLGDNILLARSVFSRIRGLLGMKELHDGTGLYLPQCNNIHTFFMKIPIDIIAIDKNSVICSVVRSLQPFKIFFSNRGTHILELPEGTIEKSQSVCGDRVEIMQ